MPHDKSSPRTNPVREEAARIFRAYLDEIVPDLARLFLKGYYPDKYKNRKVLLEDVNIQKEALLIAVEELGKPQRMPEAERLDNPTWAKRLGFKNPRQIEQTIDQIIIKIRIDDESESMSPAELRKLQETMGRLLPPEFSNQDKMCTYTAAARYLVQRALTEARLELVLSILKQKSIFQESDICSLLDSLSTADVLILDNMSMPKDTMKIDQNWRDLPILDVLSLVNDLKKRSKLSPEIVTRLAKMRVILLESKVPYLWASDVIAEIENLCGSSLSVTLNKGDVWAEQAMQDVAEMEPEARNTWNNLLLHVVSVGWSKPSAKWKKKASELLEPVGRREFSKYIAKWFSLVAERSSHEPPDFITELSSSPEESNDRRNYFSEYADYYSNLFDPYNTMALLGIVALCWGMDDPEIAQALRNLAETCFKPHRLFGARCKLVGNACLTALASMPGMQPVELLSRLKLKLKDRSARKRIEKLLRSVARQRGFSIDDLEDAAVPNFDMDEPGLLRQSIGGYTALLRFTDSNPTQLDWLRPDGKEQKSTPAEIRRDFHEDMKEFQRKKEEIRKMLSSERTRLETVYLRGRQWEFEKWRAYAIDHPLVAILARRLVWRFQKSNRDTLGCWSDGQLVDIDNSLLSWLDKDTKVSLWHPIGYDVKTVLQWRDWLECRQIRQPFKQAYREVYLLTDVERQTEIYSNRFASHILRHSQFNMLCRQRKWKYNPAMRWYTQKPPIPTLALPEWKLSAQFWVDAADVNMPGPQSLVGGAVKHLATDQVRFLDEAGQPIPLTAVSPVVFSEAMRDVDLFVSVCSVGNDPTWQDRGPDSYWTQYSFGDLSESAEIRKQVLERIIPRLKIADRCSITDKYLVVRGDLRTYRIHLRSGNVMMEPNDKHLCIVRARGEFETQNKSLFLPIEGDEMLALILSKAFLLADDKNIKDQTILSQIRRD